MNRNLVTILLLVSAGFFITSCQDETAGWPERYNAEREHTLPVFSISMDPDDLFDDSTGIYVVGKNGAVGYCNNALRRNYCQDWERSTTIEYMDFHTGERYSSPAGIKIHGNCSRNFPQKSFALFARKKYGNGKFKHRFFPDKEIDGFEAFLLRNSGNDNNRSMFRDGLMSELAREAGNLDYQAWKPVSVYINGEYWGIYNLREKLNEHYITDNHNVAPDMLHMFKDTDNLVHGRSDAMEPLIIYLRSNDLSDPSHYEWVRNELDIDSFIRYIIAEMYCANTDWPSNNVSYWRPKGGEGKWRWILYDTDLGFGLNGAGYSLDMFEWLAERAVAVKKYIPHTLIIYTELMQSDVFRAQFAGTWLEQMETVYDPSHVISKIDSIRLMLEAEMEHHAERWRMPLPDWHLEIEKMKTFAAKRPEYFQDQMNRYLAGFEE
jgi:hypothetical protein